ncbi:hypothetical protein H4R18_005810 [Coemansia javaensis]|uniref:Mediator of RNA polymerase II transcription subunit 9 n=1 Tax=Coemansia javaensis TaxID=2761396 RepID=A0A9W8H0I2_9FUNG|nr:hypothetical protein H4R18_005810 [Coemansia javaensis]
MDAALDRVDSSVEAALRTLFPPATRDAAAGDAQQRAQDFAAQVALVRQQLEELRARADAPPEPRAAPEAALEREIADLQRDIRAKDAVLAKYRAALARHIDRLRRVDEENRACIDGFVMIFKETCYLI